MAITQAMCTSFKGQLLLGVHDFRSASQGTVRGTFKLALYLSTATLDASTTTYTSSGETSGTGYTAGGGTLTNGGVTASGGTGFLTFNTLTFTTASITARGALIYNTTPTGLSDTGTTLTNPAVAVLDFGSDKTSTAGDFTITFPANTNTTAIIRIA